MVVCREILGLGAGPGDGGVTDFRAGNLNQMLWLFLRLLASREAITDTLARVDRRQLEAGVASLKTRLAAAGDPEGPLARSLKATLEIQEKRLANLDTATDNLAVIDAELERIEQQVRLVREESAIVGSPEALSARLDSVSAHAQRDLALDGPARGALHGHGHDRPRRRHRPLPAARAGGARGRRRRPAPAGPAGRPEAEMTLSFRGTPTGRFPRNPQSPRRLPADSSSPGRTKLVRMTEAVPLRVRAEHD